MKGIEKKGAECLASRGSLRFSGQVRVFVEKSISQRGENILEGAAHIGQVENHACACFPCKMNAHAPKMLMRHFAHRKRM
jgi:hypothetical protein